ncbi:hypothetical protein MTIM_07880 [Mycobacterium timonense]|uniref:Uncharacterized protein n=1 Tax=Mycobacterium timonense TaxID=701043 RepID=A0A7I9Z1R9_9MYCO|nr:hypothetical protein MTIM_07880 [Mycobacterium timonense]
MGCVPYGPRHPQNDDSTISRAATAYMETRTHPARAGTPDRRHGFTARRLITAQPLPCCVVKKPNNFTTSYRALNRCTRALSVAFARLVPRPVRPKDGREGAYSG